MSIASGADTSLDDRTKAIDLLVQAHQVEALRDLVRNGDDTTVKLTMGVAREAGFRPLFETLAQDATVSDTIRAVATYLLKEAEPS